MNKLTALTLLTALLLAPLAALHAADTSKPNIIFILTDDQGYGDLARHGHPLLKTPHADRLYNESVRFDNFYVSPSCSPTRAALLTGMHEFRNGVTHTINPREHLYKEAVTLPQLLKTAGYRTGIIGKWHLGYGPGYQPQDRGFDWVLGGAQHFDPEIVVNGVRTKRKGFREDIYFDEAMNFIAATKDHPFFLYLATFSPHAPLMAPEKFVEPFRGKVTNEEATYLGMVANIDYNVGRLLAFLKERGLEENTIVLFMNDNGATHGLDVYNAGMRGCKCTIWHGGSRAMSFWRWPGKWKPHTVDNLTAHLDVLPTLCEVAGVKIPKKLETELEGFSLRPLLESEKPQAWHDDRLLFQHVARWTSGLAAKHQYAMAGVRQGHYLLLRSRPCDDPTCRDGQCPTLRGVEKGSRRSNYTADNAQFHWGVSPVDQWALFDTKQDPGCQKNLASTQPDRVKLMAAAYDHWWDTTYPVMIERGGDAKTAEGKSRRPDRSANKEETEVVTPDTSDLAPGEEVLALRRLTKAPVMTDVPSQAAEGDLKPVYFEALPWKGQPTKVFAWLGIPKKRSGKLPGVVLVHGGGGTAFKEWVKKWNDHGFAAISIAVEGQTDEHAPKGAGTTETGWKRHEWAGPQRSGIYGDSSAPLPDQWMYHAVADTVLANSLLRSLPEVDPDRVGLMGISWGGVIASTVVGIDNRFAFAIPVYGCGHLADAGNQYGRALGHNQLYRQVWDPVLRLGNAKMPVLWFSWPQDQHFPLDCQADCYRAARGPQMLALVPGMGHGHGPAWNRPESYAFAEAVVQTGSPWCRQTQSAVKDRSYHVTFTSEKPLDKAVLVSTVDTGFTGKRNWVETPAQLTRQGKTWQVVAELPAKTTGYFVNVYSGELCLSSFFEEMTAAGGDVPITETAATKGKTNRTKP